MSDIDPTYTLAYERVVAAHSDLVAANRYIGERAAIIVGGATTISTAFASKFIADQPTVTTVPMVLVLISIACSCVAFFFGYGIWKPKAGALPGSFDMAEIWQRSIEVTPEKALANAIGDTVGAIDVEAEANETKSKAFGYMLIASYLQIVSVLLAVSVPWGRFL